MIRRAVSLAAVALALAGCSTTVSGIGSVGAASPTPGRSASTSPPSTSAQRHGRLADAMLTPADLPAGWQVRTAGGSDGNSAGGSGSGCLGDDHGPKPTTESDASFAYNGSVPTLDEDVQYFPHHAAALFRTGVRQADRCHRLPVSGHTKLTLQRIHFPTVRDATAAYRATGRIHDLPFVLVIVVFRSGPYLTSLAYSGIGSVPLIMVQNFAIEAARKLPA